MNTKYSVIFLLAFFSWLPVKSTIYYVDNDGNDNNDGKSTSTPWKTVNKVSNAGSIVSAGDIIKFKRGGLWREQLVTLSGSENNPITYTWYGDTSLPMPIIQWSAARDHANDWTYYGSDIWFTTVEEAREDVGNIIFNHGESCGTKKWNIESLHTKSDYFYEYSSRRVYVYNNQNPGNEYSSIELAIRGSNILIEGKHDIVIDGFTIRYCGTHGIIVSSGSRRTIIRNCDIYWIGGAHQNYTQTTVPPTRYGNGIEFWRNAEDHLVENNRIWKIYDSALTNQGYSNKDYPERSIQRNITYRNNIIWDVEAGYEFFNHGSDQYPEWTLTENIIFENNICVDGCKSWGVNQRDENNAGANIVFQTFRKSIIDNFIVRNNIFYRSNQALLKMNEDYFDNDSIDIQFYNNQYYNDSIGVPFSDKHVVKWFNAYTHTFIFFDSLYDFQCATGIDTTSIFKKPVFINEEKKDYRIKPFEPKLCEE